ncbi:MAG: sigma-70 family RNA polymerase sigma factor [Selenomonadaceae bacterium]|nr:sigma-70 family RNA polymerase sigma factor [Selenomonadaceae bacterium]
MTEKEFLRQVFIAYQEADSKLEQMARLQSLAQRTTTVIRNTPCGNGRALSSRVEQAVAELAGQSEHLADEIKRLLKVREEVANAIAQITNSAERRVLEYRYLAFFSWKEISHAMKMGLRTVYRLHERAVKNFSFILSGGEK